MQYLTLYTEVLSLFVIPEPLCNNNLSHFVIPGELKWRTTTKKLMSLFNHVVRKKCYISTSTRPIATKLDKEVASDERMLFAKPHNLFITCIYQVTWPVATKLDNMVPLDKGKFYIQHAKCTRSLSFDFTDLVKIHYVFKTKRLAKKIPETKRFLR